MRPAALAALVEIPAGLLDFPGEDGLTCAARELREETGYEHARIEVLAGIYRDLHDRRRLQRVRASVLGPHQAEPLSEPDGVELVFRPFVEMVIAARAGRVRDAMTALALLLAEARGVSPVR